MNKHAKAISNDLSQLAEDARALIAATADMAGDKVGEARKRLAVTLERGNEMCEQAQKKALRSARAADQAVHDYPYQAIAIGIGVGALLGFLAASSCSRSRD